MEPRVALCMRGSVSRKKYVVRYDKKKVPNDYIDYNVVYNSIKKHIIEPNKQYKFDVFIHCWDTDLENELVELYKPVKYSFEDNNLYREAIMEKLYNPKEYSQASQALTIKKVIELKEEYERENNFTYDRVILYRHDMFLWKDMILDKYNKDNIYVNQWSNNSLADFHFVMSTPSAAIFKHLYDRLDKSITHLVHSYIKYFVETQMNMTLYEDDIGAGREQEVLRKIKLPIYYNKTLTLEKLKEYGFKEEELHKYVDHPFGHVEHPEHLEQPE